ncbi:SRPBCC domain-containing protein [Microbacterium sp. BK668]|uniref:SRPBCC domain-containing protein n=1 Tax=Microbacterium sp. BK668 TaxID=2512118 RepID=UPI00105C3782|nr:SRPBCC domain-containing protein [Microbacterium sp. BK668]TDN90759.1 uncharacterized protein YndB with AHSA1/START domain [Microbacterium sp. BK668]
MRVDSASRLVRGTPDEVFDAFTDAERLLAWLPPDGMTGRFERFDADGGYRLVLTYETPPECGGKASADADVVDVARVETTRPRRIVEVVDFPSADPAYAGTMTMTWTFEPGPDGTLVTVEATDVPSGIDPHDHAVGLASSLANLARVLG